MVKNSLAIFVVALLNIAATIPPGVLPGSLSGDVQLQAGVYTGSTRISANNTTVRGVVGTVIKGGITVDGKSDVTISHVELDGTNVPVREGVRALNVTRFKLTDFYIHHFRGNGLNLGAYGGGKNVDTLVEGGTFYKCQPPAITNPPHCQGVYNDYTDRPVFRFVVVDTCGWSGTSGDTQFNHGIYVHGRSSPSIIEDCIFNNNSGQGLQMRSGGDLRRSIFRRNATALTYGYVNGSPVYTGRLAPTGWVGGVSGEVTANWFLGGRQSIAGRPRGWMVNLSNARDVHFHTNVVAHDAIGGHPAFIIQSCDGIAGYNPSQALDPAKWKLVVNNNFRHRGWTKTVDKRTGGTNVIVTNSEQALPNVNADLTKVIDDTFMGWARSNPRLAAGEGIKRLQVEAGFIELPPPVAETLEQAIRRNALVPAVESGKAVLKITTDGTDPRFDVVGNTVTPRN